MKKLIFTVLFVLILGFFVYKKTQPNFPNSPLRLAEVPNEGGTLPNSPDKKSPSQTQTDIPQTSIIAQNLDTPWAIAFLPDKSMLVTERPGRVRLIDADGNLQQNPVVTLNQVREYGEGGLLGITLDPDFSKNHFIYLYYTYSSNGNDTLNRVVRMVYESNKLSQEKIILDKVPGAIYHDGGRIKFGPDKLLYITAGDSQNPSLAQNQNSLAGKILRITSEGKNPPDNPFNNATYSYGHRNPQGIAWDEKGNLWQTEHGRSAPTGYDEVNLIQKGKNYGWPTIQGSETKPGMETPKKNSGPSTTWAPSGAAFVNKSLFFAGLKGETLYEAVIQKGQVLELKEHFKNQFGRIREVVLGPDGMLYITTSNQDSRGNPKDGDDKIIKINPNKL